MLGRNKRIGRGWPEVIFSIRSIVFLNLNAALRQFFYGRRERGIQGGPKLGVRFANLCGLCICLVYLPVRVHVVDMHLISGVNVGLKIYLHKECHYSNEVGCFRNRCYHLVLWIFTRSRYSGIRGK
jgi:hypothetical protein